MSQADSTTPGEPDLRLQLSGFGSRTALRCEDGSQVSYADLLDAADAFAARLGSTRRLVFLEAHRTPAVVAAYLGCLLHRHPVHLLPAGADRNRDNLAQAIRPNVLASGAAAHVEWLHQDAIDMHPSLALLLSTSGTTGAPRFVKLSLRNLCANARSIIEYLGIDAEHRTLLGLPMNYSYGLSILNSHLLAGASTGFTEASPLAAEFWQVFDAHAAHSFAGVPYVFESLKQEDFRFGAHRSLRYVTQAGGKLSPELVRHFAAQARRDGWKFFVMYGQTEAAPRIAYLPPELAESHAHCIGVAIPGGELSLLDRSGRVVEAADVEGELAYAGPNVMMGYASQPAELATDDTPALLMTGDLAKRTTDGLYYITGRSKRIVKPFGLRISLDALEADLKGIAAPLACFGNDEQIVLALPAVHRQRAEELMSRMARDCKLPRSTFALLVVPELPRLEAGKPDYATLQKTWAAHSQPQRPGLRQQVGLALAVLSPLPFARQVVTETLAMLGIRSAAWRGVADIYARILALPHVPPSATFDTLAGDSLSYVRASIALEEFLGFPPPRKWENMTVHELEELALNRW